MICLMREQKMRDPLKTALNLRVTNSNRDTARTHNLPDSRYPLKPRQHISNSIPISSARGQTDSNYRDPRTSTLNRTISWNSFKSHLNETTTFHVLRTHILYYLPLISKVPRGASFPPRIFRLIIRRCSLRMYPQTSATGGQRWLDYSLQLFKCSLSSSSSSRTEVYLC